MTTKRSRRGLFIGVAAVALLGIVFWFPRAAEQVPASRKGASPDPATATVTDLLGRHVKVHVPVRRVILGEGRQLYLG